MKKENLGIIISCILLIIGAIMKIMHIPYGTLITLIGFISGGIFSLIQTAQLKKRIKELEKNQK